MANCDFNIARHVFGGGPTATSSHVNSHSQGTRLTSHGEDDYSSVYDCGAAAGRCSSQTGSEWVTLSKSLLLQLVERICQLSFQSTDVVSNSSAKSEPGLCQQQRAFGPEAIPIRRPSAVWMEPVDRSDVKVAVGPEPEDNPVNVDEVEPDGSRGSETNEVEPINTSPVCAEEASSTAPESCAGAHSPSRCAISRPSPVQIDLQGRAVVERAALSPCRAAPSPGDDSPNADATSGNCTSRLPLPMSDRSRSDDITSEGEKMLVDDGEQNLCTATADNRIRSAKTPLTSPSNTPSKCVSRRHMSGNRRTTIDDTSLSHPLHRRRYIRAHRRHSGNSEVKSQPLSDVSLDVVANCRISSDDASTTSSMFLHPVRHSGRRFRGVQQPWVALNKSVVYRMLDAVLSQSAPTLPGAVAGELTASGPTTVKRSAKNRIWNPAVSSAPSSPEYTVGSQDDVVTVRFENEVNATVTSSRFSAFDGRSTTNRDSIESEHRQSADEGSASLLRDLLGGNDVISAPRRHSENTTTGGQSSSSAFVAYGLSVPGQHHSFPANVYQRRRHHSAGRDVIAPDEWLSRTSYGAISQVFNQHHSSPLMFVDGAHGRDLFRYFRSSEGLPFIASATSFSTSSLFPNSSSSSASTGTAALDYTVQALSSTDQKQDDIESSRKSSGVLDRKSHSSLPEIGRTRTGTTPRWVAFNKGDVSTLFESLATSMMSADSSAPSTASRSGANVTSLGVRGVPDDDEDDEVWFESASPDVAATRRRTRLSGGSADSVFRRPLAANEPVKWKSSLMRRMRDEVQSRGAEHNT